MLSYILVMLVFLAIRSLYFGNTYAYVLLNACLLKFIYGAAKLVNYEPRYS